MTAEANGATLMALRPPSVLSPRSRTIVDGPISWGKPAQFAKRHSDITPLSGRFASVKAGRAQGEVYIHESSPYASHTSLHSSRTLLPDMDPAGSLASPRSITDFAPGGSSYKQLPFMPVRGDSNARSKAAHRVQSYRSLHGPHSVRQPFKEREPALPLYTLSDKFKKESPRQKKISHGTRSAAWLPSMAQL